MTQSSTQSMIMGKAYEYACVCALEERVSHIRPVMVTENSSLKIAQDCFEKIGDIDKQNMRKSALAGIDVIVQMEPRILEDGTDILTISLQPDNIAKTGDIRDVIIIRRSIRWEIGISVKHNHAALKHSRLSQHIDFGKEWFQKPCSQTYFESIKPVFNKLIQFKKKGMAWPDIQNKEDSVYLPLLNAFMQEFETLFLYHNKIITSGIITYLLASNGKDYYKLIHHNNHKTTVMPFNIGGTLNQSSSISKPKIRIPKIKLPTKIIDLSFKENSKTTIILTMDEGWAISFRIHNASTYVEPSLKFDIQLLGQPANSFYFDVNW